ncbi:preprotein translocase subunit YajC [Undibacterium sp. TJN19]|uniref:preprotein translocase subunit YajC n=1 Tax=Undibacterium sp. TJN19 TaxID=3413055 RepID=UPI003BF08B76
MFISNAYAQTAGSFGGGDMSQFLIFVPVFLLMYFLMIRPQMKRQKEQKATMDALAKNDEVVTVGGILGKVTKVTDTYVTLEIANGTEIIVQKIAVTMMLPKGTIKAI